MEKEISSITCKIVLDYLKDHHNIDCSAFFKDLDPEIDALPDPEGFFSDPNNWISSTLASKIFKRAKEVLNDDMVVYKSARYAVENTSLGYAQRIIIKAFWSIKKSLKNVQKVNDRYNRNKKVALVETKRNSAVVRLHWNPTMDVTKDFCLMFKGSTTFMPIIWGGKPLILKEMCCYFEGAPYCEYHVKWTARNRFYEIFSRFYTSKTVLMEMIREMEKDKEVIEQKYDEVNRLNVELNQKIKQLLAIQETGKAILSVLHLEQLLDTIMNLLFSVCHINRAIIMLANDKKECLEYLHGVGFKGETPEEVKNYRVPLNRLSNILARVASTGRSEYIPDVKTSRLRKDNIILTYEKPISVYVAPLITRSKVIGVIATDAVDGKSVPKETRETLEIFAPQIAIAIENARLYQRLQGQMDELKRSQALLSRAEKFSFLGNLAARLAHEIKNPMTAIGTFIQLLPKKYDDEEFRKEFYEIALEETNRVNNLITELLDLVKTKEPHFEFHDLHALIDKMALLISPQSKAKKIEIIRRFDPSIKKVLMDSEKMKQVILNLLSNAVDFTPIGGKIEIATKNWDEKGMSHGIHIEIQDNGMGIPQGMIDKIFDPYFTTKHKSSMHNGTGLGLSIAHQNMQDHGGSIEVKSNVNKGTIFILNLPTDPLMQCSR